VTVSSRDRGRYRAVDQAGRYVLISVADTGHGVPEEIRDRLFEPFFTTKAPGQGSGLGLSMVYGFVRQSGGFVWLDSEAGKGTTFHIALPALDPAEDSVTRAAAAPLPASVDGTVLVVEDDAAVLSIIRRALSARGLRVLEAHNGIEALDVLATGQADLLITDVIMPRMGGLELARTLRRDGSRMPILLVSGHVEGVVEAMDSLDGPVRFLQKPFSPDQMFTVVAGMLAR
jgi:two-component system cell cycle sensor histidine kinase/response regulator CckA